MSESRQVSEHPTGPGVSRRHFLRLTAATAGGAGLAAPLLGACAGQASPKPGPASGSATSGAATKTLIWGSSADVSRMNPQLSTNFVDIGVYNAVFDQLTRRDAEMKIIPGLATEWKLLDDTTWQFKLRPGVRFHNGDPFTGADVKFSIERSFDPAARTVVAALFRLVDHVDVLDDLTVNFVMKSPDPLLPARHASYGAPIMPARYFQEVGPEGFEKQPIGSGPFKFVEWVRGDHLRLDASVDYWGGRPNADAIVVRPKPEAAARIAALLAGDVNYIDELPPDQLNRVKDNASTKVASIPYAGFHVVYVNPNVPPLDNKLTRQALSMAIDREALVKSLLNGQGFVVNGSIVKGDFAHNPDRPPLPYDPQKARQLLQAAGYNGSEIVCTVIQHDVPVAEAVVAMWQAVGVNLRIEVVETSVRAAMQREKSFKGVWIGYPGSTIGDPSAAMWRQLGPEGSNRYLDDPEFDRLGRLADSTLDANTRLQAYRRMDELTLDTVPWIPLLTPFKLYGMHRSIQWTPSPITFLDFRRDMLSFGS
jgi:peptide/nickel transport system substrate-binding protein